MKQFKKASLSFITVFILSILVLGQDTTGTGNGSGGGLAWPVIAGIALGIYEVLVRFIPTVSSWSLLTLVMSIIKTVFPDRRSNEITKKTKIF